MWLVQIVHQVLDFLRQKLTYDANIYKLIQIAITHMNKKRHIYIGEFIYGGMDGTITTFAVVAGATWWLLGTEAVLILGFANLIADGVSMSIGNYLSTKAEAAGKKNPNNEAIRTATATFVSFIVLGWFPMIPYIVHILRPEITQTDIFIASSIITWLVFILIGWTKAKITKTPLPSSILQTFGLGTVAAVLAYYVGSVLEKVIGG